MNILITGGAGFIGSHIVEHFHKTDHVRVLDNLRTGSRSNLDGLTCELIEASVNDRAAVKAAMKDIDIVFHLAAMVSVPESMLRPIECADINIIGLLNVLEEAASAGVRKLCFSSSAAIYGNNPVVPKTEDMRPEPRSPYALTKLDGEYYCQHFSEAGKLDTVGLRFFNVFGPRQDPKGAYAAAVPIFFSQAIAGEPLTIFGDGGQTRDFIYVKDVVGALSFLAAAPGVAGVYNIGYGEQITVLDLAKRVIAITQSHSQIQFAPERAGDVRDSRANVDRLCKAGFKATGTLDSGLQQMNAFLRGTSVVFESGETKRC